jgi:pimeloyl-ACP methyl ester carboxylesterase
MDREVNPVNQGMLSVNGIRLHYIDQGAGDPVLFLHGFPEYSGAWRSVMAELSGRFRAIALDTRGVNRSEGPSNVDAYALAELVEDVRQAIHALGYDRLTLVGHDWGGFIAWELAIRHPECLNRLVIVNTAHNGIFDQLLRRGGAQARASRYMLAFRSPRGEELVSRNDFAAFRKEILEPACRTGDIGEAQSAEYLAMWRRPEYITAGLNYYRANKIGPPSGDDCAPRDIGQTVVNVRTLVIWGEKDIYFTPDNLDLLPGVVPELAVRRFPDCDHWIVHQKPKEIAALIAAFIDGGLSNDNRR